MRAGLASSSSCDFFVERLCQRYKTTNAARARGSSVGGLAAAPGTEGTPGARPPDSAAATGAVTAAVAARGCAHRL